LITVILAGVGIIIAPRLGWHLDIIRSGSMEPAMKAGSVAIIKPVDVQTLKVGDVITYRSSTDSAAHTTHRIIEVRQSGESLVFHTKGDASEDADVNAVPAQYVLGRVWLSVPYVAHVINCIRTPLGLGLVIGIPAGIIIVIGLVKIRSAVRR
jgi:signal peptidase